MDKLLTRDEFRRQVFERDQHRCVFCSQPAVDAHHILERRLWPDGGYYLSNGASVCEQHHLECEMTLISVEEVREACGIWKPILPPRLYLDEKYDKWGNIILNANTRLPGELFYDESVQKILAKGGVLDRYFQTRHIVKYPRTYHLPWSPGMHKDDRMLENTNAFQGKRVIVTEKMDGENTTLYRDYIHARSIDSTHHDSRDWVKNFWSQIKHDIPEGWRVCGENLYAKHSIYYNDLPSYFIGFSIWNEKNRCLSWDETKEWFRLLGIYPIWVFYDGEFSERSVKSVWNDEMPKYSEGYVCRVADEFSMKDFRTHVGKYVRKDHILTTKHWMRGQRIIPNRLAKD